LGINFLNGAGDAGENGDRGQRNHRIEGLRINNRKRKL
jgi:hypothetical protein